MNMPGTPSEQNTSSPSPTLRERLRDAPLLFTVRGYLLLIFLVYLAVFPAAEQADVIAAVLAYGLIGLITVAALCTFLLGRRLRKRLALELAPPATRGVAHFVAGEAEALVIRTSPCRIVPFFVLELQVRLKQQGVILAKHQLTGSCRDTRLLTERISFPHRGSWEITDVSCQFGDQLGFCAFRWSSLSALSLLVQPPGLPRSGLPVISSSQRAGDTLLDMHNRQGDPFDLKPYHPSDGMRKLLWKVYAKTGELIARHPEPAMTPEGQVVIFCLAGKAHDRACSLALAYLSELETLNLEVFFACSGIGAEAIATSRAQAEMLAIEAVWQSDRDGAQPLLSDIDRLIDGYRAAHPATQLERVLVFAEERMLQNAQGAGLMLAAADHLQRAAIEPVFLLVPDTNKLIQNAGNVAAQPVAGRLLQSWFFDETGDQLPLISPLYTRFFETAANNRWQVVMANW